MNIYKFYRLDFCIRNMGLGVIAVLSSKGPAVSLAALPPLIQILLIQMHSFSANHLFDHTIWDEKNYMGEIIDNGFPAYLIYVLVILPVILSFITALLFTFDFFWLLIIYTVLFYLYQLPGLRLKNYYLLSILINAVCLGTILFLYPFLYIQGHMTPLAWILSILFFIYLSFHEIIHQIAHFGRDRIRSLPETAGIPRSFDLAVLCLHLAIITAIAGIIMNPVSNFFLSGVVIFSAVRIIKIRSMPGDIESAAAIRSSPDKFYTIYEGIYFVVFLIVVKWI